MDLRHRDGQALCVYTGGASDYYNYFGQLKDSLSLEAGEDFVTEVFFPTAQHTYPIQSHRQALVSTVADWMKEL